MCPFGVEIKNTIGNKRISTGIKGLDSLLLGGFPQGSITLVSGTPGTGKTISRHPQRCHCLWALPAPDCRRVWLG